MTLLYGLVAVVLLFVAVENLLCPLCSSHRLYWKCCLEKVDDITYRRISRYHKLPKMIQTYALRWKDEDLAIRAFLEDDVRELLVDRLCETKIPHKFRKAVAETDKKVIHSIATAWDFGVWLTDEITLERLRELSREISE